MSTRNISVRLVVEGGKVVKAELQGLGDDGAKSFEKIERQAASAGAVVTRVMGALAAAVSVREIVRYADTWTDLRSRVDLATGSQEAGGAVMERLADMARRTYSSLEMTAESWLRNATALRELGLSTKESLDFTEALNNALVVSGARAERAEQVQNALAKAMALGKLSGDALESVLVSGGRVAELLAAELGVNVNQLRVLGSQGKITGEVIRQALVGNLELLRDEADAMPATIGDAFVLLGNAALKLVGTWDTMAGASSAVAQAIIALGDNLERVAAYGLALAGVMAGRWVASFIAVQVAAMSAAGAMVVLRGALIRTGIGALIVGAAEAMLWFGRLVTATGSFGAALDALGAVGSAVWAELVAAAKLIPAGLGWVWAQVESGFYLLMAKLQVGWADFLTLISQGAAGVPGGSEIADRMATAAFDAQARASMNEHAAGRVSAGGSAGMDAAMAEWATAAGKTDAALAALQGRMAETTDEGGALAESLGRVAAASGAAGRSAKDQADAAQKVIDGLRDEIALAGQSELGKRTMVALRQAEVDAMSAQGQEIADLVEQLYTLENEQRRVTEVNKWAASSFTDLFGNATKGAKDLGDAVGNLIGQLGQMAINQGFISLLTGSGLAGSPVGQALSGFFGLGVPTYAAGTGFHPGGLARINERGGEIVNLPRGTQVIPHDVSRAMASRAAPQEVRVHVTTGVSVDRDGSLLPFVQDVAVANARAIVSAEMDGVRSGFNQSVRQAVTDPRMSRSR